MSHIPEHELHDWVDGVLERERAVLVEAHVAGCETCARAAASVRALLDELHALPRSIEPERDLRPGIHARVTAGVVDAVEIPNARERSWLDASVRAARLPLAAAALLLIAMTALVTALVLRDTPEPVLLADGDSLAAVEARYAAAIYELQSLVHDRRGELPPEALRLLGESLAIVDAALAETRAALRDEPDNPALPPVLLAAYERKVELLRGAVALESET